MGVAVDADVEPLEPWVSGRRRPVDHSQLNPLHLALDAFREARIVRSVAVDGGQRRYLLEAFEHRRVLPVSDVPDLVDAVEATAHLAQEHIDLVASLGIADEPDPYRH